MSISRLQKQTDRANAILEQGASLEIYFVDAKTSANLHQKFLSDPTPTDVITFHHGEIFICPAIAEKQRRATGLSLHDEVLTYIIHGILHLCGYDDHTDKDFVKMKRKQEEILERIKQPF